MLRNKLIPAYFLLVGLPLLILLAVLKLGAALTGPAAVMRSAGSTASTPAAMNLFVLILQVLVVLAASRLVGMLFKKIQQPQVGSAMSITAFPVLARILTERNLLGSRMGTLAISCSAVDDVTGWCVLAYIVMLVRSGSSSTPLHVTVGGVLVYVLVMIVGVKRLLPFFEKSFRRHGRLTDNALSLMIVSVLVSALATERLGIHSLFGAFFMGVIMPKSADFVHAVLNKLESLTVTALLPLFFAFSELRTSVGMVHGELWIFTLLVIGTAVAGKFGGCMFAARLAGVSWRDATSLGILMNTRGLMELIALNIGLDVGVISPTVFTIMVLMALVTTFMTSPLLEWFYPARLMAMAIEDGLDLDITVDGALNTNAAKQVA